MLLYLSLAVYFYADVFEDLKTFFDSIFNMILWVLLVKLIDISADPNLSISLSCFVLVMLFDDIRDVVC